jgi:hypothetical protein
LGVISNKLAPITLPTMPTNFGRTRPSYLLKFSRNPQVLARHPGNNATVPVALAANDGTPANIKAGSVKKVPLPAAAFSHRREKPC